MCILKPWHVSPHENGDENKMWHLKSDFMLKKRWMLTTKGKILRCIYSDRR